MKQIKFLSDLELSTGEIIKAGERFILDDVNSSENQFIKKKRSYINVNGDFEPSDFYFKLKHETVSSLFKYYIIEEITKSVEELSKEIEKTEDKIKESTIVMDIDLKNIKGKYKNETEENIEGFDTKFKIETKDGIIANFISRPVNYRNGFLELEVIKNDETAKYIKEGLRTIIGDTFPRAYKIIDIDEFSTRKDRFLVSFDRVCSRPEDDLKNKIAKNN